MSEDIFYRFERTVIEYVETVEKRIRPNIVIMSPETFRRIMVFIRLTTVSVPNDFDKKKIFDVYGCKLTVIISTDIPDGEFMLATNFKK